MLRGALTGRTSDDVRVMTAVPMQSIAEPFIRLRAVRHREHGSIVIMAGGIGQPYVTTDYPSVQRALELDADALLVAKRGVDGVYDMDPNVHAGANRYRRLSYREAIRQDLRIMDASAFILAEQQQLIMHVFDVSGKGLMRDVCLGEDVGTTITTG
jgi:uridylate kinase